MTRTESDIEIAEHAIQNLRYLGIGEEYIDKILLIIKRRAVSGKEIYIAITQGGDDDGR